MSLHIGPRSPPRGLSAYAYGPTVIGLTWSPPPTMDINGVIDYYVVEVNEIHTGRSWTFQATDPHMNISSLHPYYIYECKVAAFTFVQGPFTNPLQIVSGEDGKTSYLQVISVIFMYAFLWLQFQLPHYLQLT